MQQQLGQSAVYQSCINSLPMICRLFYLIVEGILSNIEIIQQMNGEGGEDEWMNGLYVAVGRLLRFNANLALLFTYNFVGEE